jgi:hypothetical protein
MLKMLINLTYPAHRFVPLLVALLSGASIGLAGAAADVLTEIVLKRMDASAKLRYLSGAQMYNRVKQCLVMMYVRKAGRVWQVV